MKLTVEIEKKLGDFSLDVQFASQAKRIGILGASGCGKSMTLKSIAGIETPDKGLIQIGERVLFDSASGRNVKPQKRKAGYLFQNYALFPAMNVEKNIAAGLKGKKQEKQRRVHEMVEKFELRGLEKRLPGELSGGQQQRVALARIMAYEPEMILLDEPFSALDMFLKDRLQQELTRMLASYHGIVVMVSHSRDEIYRFCEELLIMEKGKGIVCGKTKEIFENPLKKEAAKLTGCKNFSAIRRIDAHTAQAVDWDVCLRTKKEIPQQAAFVGYRAHDFIPVWGEKRANCLPVTEVNSEELPFERHYYLSIPAAEGPVCWFVQREKCAELDQRGLPSFLELEEAHMMFLS